MKPIRVNGLQGSFWAAMSLMVICIIWLVIELANWLGFVDLGDHLGSFMDGIEENIQSITDDNSDHSPLSRSYVIESPNIPSPLPSITPKPITSPTPTTKSTTKPTNSATPSVTIAKPQCIRAFWLVLASDRTLQSAEYELRRFERCYPNVKIIQVEDGGGFPYKTVVGPFENAQSAQKALACDFLESLCHGA